MEFRDSILNEKAHQPTGMGGKGELAAPWKLLGKEEQVKYRISEV